MDASVLLALRDPAGVPFYPIVFQVLYILTWALHAAFVLLSLGAMGLSLYGSAKGKTDKYWSILTTASYSNRQDQCLYFDCFGCCTASVYASYL